jgi:hypothetical protein
MLPFCEIEKKRNCKECMDVTCHFREHVRFLVKDISVQYS